ncbi:hypothetical protein [Bacillus thuringiensis]|uniref:hypothetical protein n=1 Tax=Bacillus thuringiensis TaxID=1428 RepID=UPI000BF73126|nr:hypothetical protein [Bacillus thuringiensis]PFN47089.1 hypothetical protein COJ75_30110 [Bacillus thuringiensis]
MKRKLFICNGVPSLKTINAPRLEEAGVILKGLKTKTTINIIKADFSNLRKTTSLGENEIFNEMIIEIKVSNLEFYNTEYSIGSEVFVYSSVSFKTTYTGVIGQSLEITDFGSDDKWKMGRRVRVAWYEGAINPVTPKNLGNEWEITRSRPGTVTYIPVIYTGGIST